MKCMYYFNNAYYIIFLVILFRTHNNKSPKNNIIIISPIIFTMNINFSEMPACLHTCMISIYCIGCVYKKMMNVSRGKRHWKFQSWKTMEIKKFNFFFSKKYTETLLLLLLLLHAYYFMMMMMIIHYYYNSIYIPIFFLFRLFCYFNLYSIFLHRLHFVDFLPNKMYTRFA